MASALFVIIGGVLAVLHGILIWSDVTIGRAVPEVLADIPAWWLLTTGVIAIGFGVMGYIHQAWALTLVGLVASFVSFGLLGSSTIVATIALWPFIRSFMEGEETRLDFRRMHSHEWPDKAIMASVVLASAGALALLQVLLLLAGRVDSPVGGPAWVWALVSAISGTFAIASGRHVFHLRHAWMGWTAAALQVVTLAFWVIGPILGMVALVYLALAYREAEFILEPAGTSARP